MSNTLLRPCKKWSTLLLLANKGSKSTFSDQCNSPQLSGGVPDSPPAAAFGRLPKAAACNSARRPTGNVRPSHSRRSSMPIKNTGLCSTWLDEGNFKKLGSHAVLSKDPLHHLSQPTEFLFGFVPCLPRMYQARI